MKKMYILIFVIAMFLVGCNQNNNSNSTKNMEIKNSVEVSNDKATEIKTYFGEWEIKELAFYGVGGVYSSDDLDKMIGRKLIFSEIKATCFGDMIEYLDMVVKNPKYVENNITKKEFLNGWKLSMDEINFLPNNIVEVTVEQSNNTKCHFLVIDKDSLLLIGGGVFLLLDRVGNV